MNINIQSEEFKNNLYSLIGTSELPIANIYYILKIVLQQTEDAYNQVIENLRKAETQVTDDQESKEETE